MHFAPSSGAPGDPVAIANASFQASAIALQTTKSLGQQFLSSIGLGGAPTAATGGRVRGPEAIEYVIDICGEGSVGIGTDFTQGYGQEFFDWLGKNEQMHRVLIKDAGFLAQ